MSPNDHTSTTPTEVAGPVRRRRKPSEVRRLTAAAAKTLFESRGYRHTTTRDVAELASVSETLIFRYYGSKAGLFEECIVKPLRQSLIDVAATYDPADPSSREYFHRLFSLLRENRATIAAMFSTVQYEADFAPKPGDTRSPIGPLFEPFEALTRADAAKYGYEEDKPEITSAISIATMLGLVTFENWLFNSSLSDSDFNSLMDETWEHILHGRHRLKRIDAVG